MNYTHKKTGISAKDHPNNSNVVIINGTTFPKEFVNSPDWETSEILFVTEDGVSIKPGNSWWYIKVPEFSKPVKTSTLGYSGDPKNKKDVIRFSTRDAAIDYIIRNKPMLSFNDIEKMNKEGLNQVYMMIKAKVYSSMD
jgi:hypothetical protein